MMLDEICVRRYRVDSVDLEDWHRSDGVDFTRARAEPLAEWRVVSMSTPGKTALARAVVMVVRAMLNAVEPCTNESHAADKLKRPAVLVYRGPQLGDDGEILFVYVDCPRCFSTLAVDPEEMIASVGPRMESVRS